MTLTSGRLFLVLLCELSVLTLCGSIKNPCHHHFHFFAPNICLRVEGAVDSFCHANRVCATRGFQLGIPVFLVARDYQYISRLSSKHYAWTGITRLLDLASSHPGKDFKWQYSSTTGLPTQLTQSDLHWAVGEPVSRIYNTFVKAIRTVNNTWTLTTTEDFDMSYQFGDVVCQQDLQGVSFKNVPEEGLMARFRKVGLELPLIIEQMNGQSVGCYDTFSDVSSHMQCLFK